ncbi:MAG TPA: gamma-glutamylcyclotransferase family protein [Terriglobales bacterium]|nr:gamma-glutamylcyclotransferase family protein [Terriglobales bacterium]
MRSPVPKHLFVYGTLRRAHTPPEAATLMHDLEFISGASTPGTMFDLGEYPGAVFDPESGSEVKGEVYRLPLNSDVLKKLDEYEEFKPRSPRQSLFVREAIVVRTSDGKKLSCWTYRFNADKMKKKAVQRKQSVRAVRAASRRAVR